MINIAADHIGCLSAHARKRRQLLDTARYFPVEFVYKLSTAAYDISCLIMIKTGGFDILLQFIHIRPGKSLNRRIFPEQILCHDIDAGIRTLCA